MSSDPRKRIGRLKELFGSGKPSQTDLRKLCYARQVLLEVTCGHMPLNDAIIACYRTPDKFQNSDRSIPTDLETQFSRCMIAVIDLTINHEIGIAFFRSVINHDFDEVILHGSLASARRNGFLPKAMGWEKFEKEARRVLPELN
jgi:hypothetical protein